ncbi:MULTISPECIES: hypothetical protein [Legionella]|uniref:hypothetical protein n=1 Tax=Legionella TaxID=445 RepID=UPI000A771395|nr:MULTISPECIES: hypothetical protein [Legionella]
MQSKDDSSSSTESTKKTKSILSKPTESAKKTPKSVSWNDDKTEGKMDEGHLVIRESASLNKKTLDKQIVELQKSGYTEIEATAIVGKAQTPSGQVIITEPIFYASKEEIAEGKKLREENKVNPCSFFSPTTIGVGVGIALAVATVGIVAFSNQ